VSDEISTPVTEASAPVDAGLGSEDVSLNTAVHASDGLHDATAPAPAEGASLSELKDQELAPKYTDSDLERIREEERLRLSIERQRADMQQLEQYKQQQARQARDAALAEERDLLNKAQQGDLKAQQALYERSLEEVAQRQKREELDRALEPERAVVRDQVRRSVWEQFAQSFGMSPDDPDLLSIPGDKGLKGITAEILRKTSEKDLLDAIKSNPQVQRWVKEETETGAKAAQARGMARALGSPEAPRADVGGSAGRGLSGDALERALMESPDDSGLYKAWVDQEKSAGRYW